MTSFTHLYRNSIFTRIAINLVIFLLIYMAVVRPLRMQVTAKVVYPVLSILLNDSAEAFLSSDGVSVQIKFQGVDDRIAVITPFGVLFFGIPLTLLFSAHNWRLVKALTYYHITLTFILPILFSVFFKPWVWIFVPTDFSHYLSQFLGMSFCLFALKGIYNEHCKIRKASVV